MKILMLGWELPPYNSGGLGVACYQMCKYLALRDVEIEFVVPYQAPHKASFMKIHGAIPKHTQISDKPTGAYDGFCYTCHSAECGHAYAGDLRAQQRRYTQFVEQLVAKNHYDAIHAHDWLTFEAGMIAKARTNLPLIAHVHATEFDRSGQHRGNPIVQDIEYNGLMMADRVVAVSNITKAIIQREYGIPGDKIEVVHNSIDTHDLQQLDPTNAYQYLAHMKSLGYKVVVSLGRLTIQKGMDYLLQAAQKAIARNPRILFLVAGDGELREALIMQAAELGIAHNIIFTGFVRGKQWRDAYAIGDMFVMSSVSEPFGLTALEAATHHNAILLTKQSGVGEVLKSVINIDFWDTDRIADAILNIAEHHVLQQGLADGALREVTTMSWQHVAEACQRIYQGVIPQKVVA